jgi:hypothetical protein
MTDTFAAFSGTGSSMRADFLPENCGVANQDIKPFNLICGSLDGCASSQASWFEDWKKRVTCRGEQKITTLSSTSTCMSFDSCGKSGREPLEVCMIQGLGHCWSGNDCCDSQCTGQNKANMDASSHLLQWFDNVPLTGTPKTATQVAANLRRKIKSAPTFIYRGLTNATSAW